MKTRRTIQTMKKYIISTAVFLFMGASYAIADEVPYINTAGAINGIKSFYFSPNETQFLPTFAKTGLLPSEFAVEGFTASRLVDHPEVCDTEGGMTLRQPHPIVGLPGHIDRGLQNAYFPAGNVGNMTWTVILPEKPTGEINLCFKCGVLMPDAFMMYGYKSVTTCAAEEGELVGPGICYRQATDPGVNPIKSTALPYVSCVAKPGPEAPVPFSPFHLTAYKNPGSHAIAGFTDFPTPAYPPLNPPSMVNDATTQVINGSSSNRILLRSCVDNCLVVKLPVNGQINALSEKEYDLEQADIIQCTMSIPAGSTVDTYCSSASFRIEGIGEEHP